MQKLRFQLEKFHRICHFSLLKLWLLFDGVHVQKLLLLLSQQRILLILWLQSLLRAVQMLMRCRTDLLFLSNFYTSSFLLRICKFYSWLLTVYLVLLADPLGRWHLRWPIRRQLALRITCQMLDVTNNSLTPVILVGHQ